MNNLQWASFQPQPCGNTDSSLTGFDCLADLKRDVKKSLIWEGLELLGELILCHIALTAICMAGDKGRAGQWESLGPGGLGVPGMGSPGAAGLWFAESWVTP